MLDKNQLANNYLRGSILSFGYLRKKKYKLRVSEDMSDRGIFF